MIDMDFQTIDQMDARDHGPRGRVHEVRLGACAGSGVVPLAGGDAPETAQ